MNYYNEIKNILTDNIIYNKVKDYSKNKHDLESYYRVGKLLIEAQGGETRAKYGDGLIKEYSKKLTQELGKGYTTTNLKNMRNFYIICSKSQTVSDQLTWSHYVELLKLNNINEIKHYINLSINNNLSVRDLRNRIKNNEYERLSNNAKDKLINNNKLTLSDSLKNPLYIKNKYDTYNISEKVLKMLILENITSFLEELGEGYCFINSEYKIKIGNNYNYIDLLLFNIKYNSYIVIELKVTELKKEHIGQINTYMNYIDKYLKTKYHNKTIGIIIVRKDNKFIMEYSSDKRILSREYLLI